MRTIGHALPRLSRQLVAEAFTEEGRGLGFSIGGWHPFRINTYLPTLKKLDPLANTSLGKAVWKPIEKINQTVNKDFAKGKVWSQNHRKTLQIAAALATAVVGGYYAYGALTAGAGSGAAAGVAGAGEAVAGTAGATASTSSVFAAETLVPLSTTSVVVPSSLLAPAAVGGTLTAAAPAAAAAVGGTSILSSIGGVLGSIAKDIAPIMAIAKAVGGGGQQQGQPSGGDAGYYGGGGYTMGGGGGGSLGPILGATDQTAAPAPVGVLSGIPAWAWIIGGGALLYAMWE